MREPKNLHFSKRVRSQQKTKQLAADKRETQNKIARKPL
jgi:hypothetical protein